MPKGFAHNESRKLCVGASRTYQSKIYIGERWKFCRRLSASAPPPDSSRLEARKSKAMLRTAWRLSELAGRLQISEDFEFSGDGDWTPVVPEGVREWESERPLRVFGC